MSKDPSQSTKELKHLIEKYNETVFELRRQAKEHATHENSSLVEENLRKFNEKTNNENEEHFRELSLKLQPHPEEKNETEQLEKTPHPEYKPTHQKNEDEHTKPEHLKKDEHIHQLIHELRAELIHLDETHHSTNTSTSEKQDHFFKHRIEALAHANAHWFHVRHCLDLLFELTLEEEFEELLALQHRMKYLAEEIEREQAELNETLNVSPMQPHPEPPHPNEKEEDKD